MKAIWKAIRHNHLLVIAMAMSLVVLVLFYGCESQVLSLNGDGRLVTRAELQLELDQLVRTAEQRAAELDQKDSIKQLLVNTGLVVAKGGKFNPVGLVTSLAALLGFGAIADNRRKDAVIRANLKGYVNSQKIAPAQGTS